MNRILKPAVSIAMLTAAAALPVCAFAEDATRVESERIEVLGDPTTATKSSAVFGATADFWTVKSHQTLAQNGSVVGTSVSNGSMAGGTFFFGQADSSLTYSLGLRSGSRDYQNDYQTGSFTSGLGGQSALVNAHMKATEEELALRWLHADEHGGVYGKVGYTHISRNGTNTLSSPAGAYWTALNSPTDNFTSTYDLVWAGFGAMVAFNDRFGMRDDVAIARVGGKYNSQALGNDTVTNFGALASISIYANLGNGFMAQVGGKYQISNQNTKTNVPYLWDLGWFVSVGYSFR